MTATATAIDPAALAQAQILASLDETLEQAAALAEKARKADHYGPTYHLVTSDLLALFMADATSVRLSTLLASPLAFHSRREAELVAFRWNEKTADQPANQVAPMHRRAALLAVIEKVRALRAAVLAA